MGALSFQFPGCLIQSIGQGTLSYVSASRPNIVVITTHDSGRHFGCYGEHVSTPAIDALASDGVRCTGMFAVAPICSPSRAALLTGQVPQRNGMMGLAGGPWQWELNDYRAHLSHVAQAGGYSTHLFGHQHETDYVERLEFDELHTYLSPHDRSYAKNAPAIAHDFASFCRRRPTDRPFYAQVGFFETHTPHDFGYATPDDPSRVTVPAFVHRNDEATRAKVAALNGAARRADEAVGIILQALRDSDIERDTLVLFNTDHGAELPRGKWSLLDGGLGIGFILRWHGGGIVGGRTCDLLLGNVDFLPTLSELTGLPVPHPMDGRSFAAALRGDASAMPVREEIHALYVAVPQYAVRTRRYKLIRHFRGDRLEPVVHDENGRPKLEPALRLYDLQRDPLELRDVADDPEYQAAREEMDARLWRHLEAVNDPILKGPIPTPYYKNVMRDYEQWRTRHA